MIRAYLKLHLWLKARCERLTLRQRKTILYSVCTIYFLCCIGLIMPLFIPEKKDNNTEQTETKQHIPKLIDTPIRTDSLYQNDTIKQLIT